MELEGLVVIEELPQGNEASSEKGLVLSPGRIYDWVGEYCHDGSPRTLHCGRSASTEVLLTAYLKAASRIPTGDYRWIPVSLSDVESATANWVRRKGILGDLAEAINRCYQHGLFLTLIYQEEPYLMPTQKGIEIMTAAGHNVAPLFHK